MAATTISTAGLVLTNDTGTTASPNGDGTILNAALWALLLTRINGCFSGAFTVGGLLAAEGFGTHAFSAGGTGSNQINVRNTTAGAGNLAQINLGNDATIFLATLAAFSSTYTTAGPAFQAGTLLQVYGAGGLSIASNHASGTVRVYTNGNALRTTWETDGAITHVAGLRLSGQFNQAVTGNTDLSGSASTTVLCRITSASSTPKITGAYGVAGQLLIIKNVSGSAVTLAHESASAASPPLRFDCPGNADVGIDDSDMVMAIYDDTSARWHVLGI